jgi:N,N'-diacetyllegionaminate synthase
MKTIIIAEAGVNHNGDINLARKMVTEAYEAGADIVKFQTFKADNLVTKTALKANYQLSKTSKNETHYEMLKRLELTESMHDELLKICKDLKIEFCSAPFDIESVEYLIGIGVKRIKIPSGEITNLPYLNRIGSSGMPIILSTGMSTMEEIGDAIKVLEDAGSPRDLITVLHCNSEYPIPINEVNLSAMKSIHDEFGVKIGFSDHTEGIEVSIAAVALGANIIEKHFTLDRNLPGPDHRASILPHELKEMVRSIRNIEQAIGDGVKQPSSSEKKNLAVARKSIVASKKIVKGTLFSNENITCKRPGEGISPMQIDKVIGSKAKKNFDVNEYITL